MRDISSQIEFTSSSSRQKGNPIRPVVKKSVPDIFDAIAFSPGTSQLRHKDLPSVNLASGLAAHTVKEAGSSTITY